MSTIAHVDLIDPLCLLPIATACMLKLSTCNNDKAIFDYCWIGVTALGGMVMTCMRCLMGL